MTFSEIFTYLYNTFHYISPCLIHSCKSSSFLRHLRHNVWRTENGLQVEPCGLDFEPFIQNFLKQQELALPFSEKQNTVVQQQIKQRLDDKTQNHAWDCQSCMQCCYSHSIPLPSFDGKSLHLSYKICFKIIAPTFMFMGIYMFRYTYLQMAWCLCLP